MIWKPKTPAIIRASADALDRYGNPRMRGGLPSHRRLMMAAGAGPYRYFRLDCTANNGGVIVAVGELEWMVGGTAYPTSNMSSNAAPSPLVASASTEFSASFEAWKAFDGSAVSSNAWQSGSGITIGWLKIDLGAGNAITPTSAKLTADDTLAVDRMPKDFTLEASNTGAFSGEETVLKTLTGETAWSQSEVREYTF